MNHYETGKGIKDFFLSCIPNNKDNLKQIIIKLLFIISVIAVIVSGVYTTRYFLSLYSESKNLEEYRDIKSSYQWEDALGQMQGKNSDIKGWLKAEGLGIDRPIYQTDNNTYYLNYNSSGKSSEKGELFFDYRSKVNENEVGQNLVIYGNSSKNGELFGNLRKLRNISFYRKNPTIKLSVKGREDTYSIYAVFILNADKKDDGGYVYNISKNNFSSDDEFYNWVKEAKERSVITTDIEVARTDNILTLVTSCDDFPNARLVVMANGNGYNSDFNIQAETNHNPRYPEKWYHGRGMVQ